MRLISYTTKPEFAAENRDKIAAVFDNLAEAKLADFQYAVFESGEGNFMHVVESTPAGSEALQNLPAFRNFLSGLHDRQSVANVITELKVVGTYGGLVRP